jgi:hypothetical protein
MKFNLCWNIILILGLIVIVSNNTKAGFIIGGNYWNGGFYILLCKIINK